MDFIFIALLVFFTLILYVVPTIILITVFVLVYKSLKQSFKQYGDLNDLEENDDP
jgi:hypothetical protein